jgi:surfeit locus 1 family protein
MKFKPKPIPTFITAVSLIVLITLGSWQMSRLQWKQSVIKEMNERSSLEAMNLPTVIDNFDELKYRRVKLRGEFLHEKEVHLFVGAMSERGRPGYDILTPFKKEDGTYVLVDRGWVDSDNKAAEKRPETLLKGVVEIEGMVHKAETKGRFTPDNDVAKNLWFWIDIEAIKSYAGVDLKNLYIRALKKESDNTYPIAGDKIIKIRNDHLQYAITWYSFAIILLVIYFLYHKKENDK